MQGLTTIQVAAQQVVPVVQFGVSQFLLLEFEAKVCAVEWFALVRHAHLDKPSRPTRRRPRNVHNNRASFLRPEDCGLLWEHLVLDTLLSIPAAQVCFWRDKQQREVDFVIPRGRGKVDAIECKWNVDSFEARGLAAFRENYSQGKNFVVCLQNATRYQRKLGDLVVEFLPIAELRAALAVEN